jgi:hypothetical protein
MGQFNLDAASVNLRVGVHHYVFSEPCLLTYV